jgi:hypothetical protein
VEVAHHLDRPHDNTRVHFTEAEIRAEHPDAVRVEGSRILVDLPDTAAERAAALKIWGSVE